MHKEGFLAVTATDTSALTGTYPKATKRKYWADSYRTEFLHEQAIRILIRKVQMIGAYTNTKANEAVQELIDQGIEPTIPSDQAKTEFYVKFTLWTQLIPFTFGFLAFLVYDKVLM